MYYMTVSNIDSVYIKLITIDMQAYLILSNLIIKFCQKNQN